MEKGEEETCGEQAGGISAEQGSEGLRVMCPQKEGKGKGEKMSLKKRSKKEGRSQSWGKKT